MISAKITTTDSRAVQHLMTQRSKTCCSAVSLDDSASLSGSVLEVPCNTVVVADGRETEHSPILFPVPYSDQRDASGSLLSREAYVYDLSAHHLHHQLFQS